MAEPQTEAGRALLGLDMAAEECYWVNLGSNEMSRAILAIEQEARHAVLADVRRGVEPEWVARQFHEAYERLAPSFGYETRKASAVPWSDVPEPNRSLMVAVASEVLSAILDAAETP